MTVKELLDVISAQKEIFIKPCGRRMYFDGIAEDVPEDLYNAVVTEIVPQVYRDDDYNAIRRYYGAMGVWVIPIPAWNEKADRKAAADKAKKAAEKVRDRMDRMDFSDITPIPDELLTIEDGERVR